MAENWVRMIQLISTLQQNRIVLTEAMMVIAPEARYKKLASKINYGHMDVTKEDLDTIEYIIQVYKSL